jgi:chaperonin GroES
MAKIRPLDDRVVVEPIEVEDKTSGGIFLPDSAKEKSQKGKIVATGPGKLLDSGNRSEMCVAAGDVVLYGKYSGTEVKVDGQDLLIMREGDLLARID